MQFFCKTDDEDYSHGQITAIGVSHSDKGGHFNESKLSWFSNP